jgi:VWFA-related protein
VTDRLTTAIASLEARGGTALYDAVWRASELLAESQPDRRRVVVVLSDGRDESASGLEPGSLHTLQEAVRAAHLNDVTVYSIGLGRQLESDLDFEGKSTTSEILSRISGSTGGTFTAVEKAGRLDAAFRGVVEELRSLYSIAYSMPVARPGETWRSISVRVARPGVNARAREGYFVR